MVDTTGMARALAAGSALSILAMFPTGTVRAVPTVPHIIVQPNPARMDQGLSIHLTGFSPRRVVRVNAQLTDSLGTTWRSWATFRTDSHGGLDISRHTPLDGTYAAADSMGLIWSAYAVTSTSIGMTGLGLMGVTSTHPEPLVLTAEVQGKRIAQTRVARRIMTTAIVHTALHSGGLYGELFRPAGRVRVPAVIVVGGSEGGLSPYVEREAALVAVHGYAALALAYFGEPHLPRSLTNIPLEYFGKAITWLRRQPSVRPDRLGIIGTSRGGELALLLATRYPQIHAVVSYSGSGLVVGSPAETGAAAWTWQGTPIKPGEAIPVEVIRGPVVLVAGEDDRIWNSVHLSQIALNRLRSHHHPYGDRLLKYEGGGHLIQPPYIPTAVFIGSRYGGDLRDQAVANADSWRYVLAALKTLRSSAS